MPAPPRPGTGARDRAISPPLPRVPQPGPLLPPRRRAPRPEPSRPSPPTDRPAPQGAERPQPAAARPAAPAAARCRHPPDDRPAGPQPARHRHGGLRPHPRRGRHARGRHRHDGLYARRRRPGDAPRHLRAQRRPRHGVGLAADGRGRPLADRLRAGPFRVARARAQRRHLARLHRPRLHRSRRHRLQRICRRRRRREEAALVGRRRHRRAVAGDPPLARQGRPHHVDQISARRELRRLPRAAAGAPPRRTRRRRAARPRAAVAACSTSATTARALDLLGYAAELPSMAAAARADRGRPWPGPTSPRRKAMRRGPSCRMCCAAPPIPPRWPRRRARHRHHGPRPGRGPPASRPRQRLDVPARARPRGRAGRQRLRRHGVAARRLPGDSPTDERPTPCWARLERPSPKRCCRSTTAALAPGGTDLSALRRRGREAMGLRPWPRRAGVASTRCGWRWPVDPPCTC